MCSSTCQHEECSHGEEDKANQRDNTSEKNFKLLWIQLAAQIIYEGMDLTETKHSKGCHVLWWKDRLGEVGDIYGSIRSKTNRMSSSKTGILLIYFSPRSPTSFEVPKWTRINTEKGLIDRIYFPKNVWSLTKHTIHYDNPICAICSGYFLSVAAIFSQLPFTKTHHLKFNVTVLSKPDKSIAPMSRALICLL